MIPPHEMKQQIKAVANERMAICETCDFHSKHHKTLRPDAHCTDCGCTLSAKVSCLSCSCELNVPKWEAVLTDQQEMLLEELKENEGDKGK